MAEIHLALEHRDEQREARIVGILEEALLDAKAGKFESVFLVFDLAAANKVQYRHSGCANIAELVGKIERAKLDLLRDMDE